MIHQIMYVVVASAISEAKAATVTAARSRCRHAADIPHVLSVSD